MAKRDRFPVSRALAGELFPVFWNEYLFRLNSCQRKGLSVDAADYFSVTANAGGDRTGLLALRYTMASLIHLVLLFLRTQKAPRSGTPLLLFTNLRHGRFFTDASQPVRVGLYNLRYLNHPHLLAVLSPGEWLQGLALAITRYPAFIRDGRRRCAEAGVDWSTFRRLAFFGRLRHLDAVLHALALEKFGGEVWCPGHFDLYVALASQLRERGALARFVGRQHGLFERAPAGRDYERLFADRYLLLFEESRAWVCAHFLKNPACEVALDAKPAHIEFQALPRTPGDRVIAFAAQEITKNDVLLIERLLAYREHAERPVSVLLYTHPLYPCDDTAWARRGLQTFAGTRHGNIDVLITRFSTLGLDYHRQGVPVVFVPFADRVCIFDDPAFTVCDSLEAMDAALTVRLAG